MSVQLTEFPAVTIKRAWAFGSIATLLVLVAFGGSLIELVHRWTTQEEYSHGFLVPLVTAWLLWMRRDALFTSIARPAWSGPILILAAMLMHAIGQLSAIYILSQLAFIIALFGIILAVGGFPLLQIALIPTAFLIFAIPLPYFIDASLSLELQLLSSRLGVAVISFFQIPVYLEGNLIDLGTYKLQVVDACSGLRYLFPLLSISFLTAYLFQAPLWQRALLLFSSIPITIMMNGLRIGIIGVTVDRWGPQAAEGALHFFEGWIIFAASALLLAAEAGILVKVSGKRFLQTFDVTAQPARRSPQKELEPADRAPRYVSLFLVCAILLTGSLISNRSEIAPGRSRFVTFPTRIGGWQGFASLLEPQVEHSLALDDYILSDYRNSDGKAVNLYVAYYVSQRTGESPHSPLVCIPGDGWSITRFERTNDGPDGPINRAIIERNGTKQLVYYWYEERGRRLASEYWSKWYLLYDAITKNRSDGALVRLITEIQAGEVERDADDRLRLFIHDLGPVLGAFLGSSGESNVAADVQSPEHRAPKGNQ
jgi:exosortase D (VPLPA-CTERM-specific)